MDNSIGSEICTGYSDKGGEASIYKNGNVNVFDIVSTIYGGYRGGVYRNGVVLERDKLVEALNNFKGYKTNILQLKGDMAEFYHAGTFNINAAQRGSRHRVIVDRSHGLGSADISGNFDKNFGLKYYKDGGETAKQQAKSIREAYEKYKGNGGTDSIKEYLEKNGYKAVDENAPLYEGQIRIVPKEQLEDVKKWLERKIAEESLKRPEQVKRYQETLDMLDDRLRDGKNASLPLTNEEAKEIARIAKEGGIDSKILELTDEEIIRMKYVVTNAAKVGLEAAAVAAALSLVLSFYKKYKDGRRLEDYTVDDWKDIFGSTIFNAGRAGISAATLSVVGSFSQSAVPGVSALLMAVFGIASLVPDYMNGKMTKDQFIVEAEMICIDAAIILLGTAVGQMAIPLPGLGALLGAIAASIAYNIIESIWGDELRDVLDALNQRIENLLEKIKTILKDLWDRIASFFENIYEYILYLQDKEFNEKLHYMYKERIDIYLKDNMIENRKIVETAMF